MKKFLLFAYDSYEARGGLNDLVGSFDTLEEAIAVSREPDVARRFGVEYVLIFDRDAPGEPKPVWELTSGDNT